MATQGNDEALDELRDDDIALKLNSIRKLSTIALALGENRTRNELLPYLLESTPEEDELLVALAEEVGNMVPLVGGPTHAPSLVPLLEALAKEEETVVRDAAVASLSKVGKTFSRAQAMEHLVPCIRRLKNGEWFTNRVSVCGLFATACPLFSSDTATTQELCGLFRELCRDDTPMVRRAAASNIGPLADAVDARTVQQALMPMLIHLVKDDQESVRKLALESTPAFARSAASGSSDALPEVLDACNAVFTDRSWRVRHSAAAKMPALAEALGPELSEEHLVKPFVSFLQDQEAEVRVAAAEASVDFCSHVPMTPSAFLADILVPLKSLATDSHQHVRCALASKALQLTPQCTLDDSGTHMLDLILTLLKDKVPEVRLNIIQSLHHAQDVLSNERLRTSVVPAIDELSSDPHWRVRQAVITQLPLLARQLGLEFYEGKLLARNRDWLRDPVATIREAAIKALIDVAKVFGDSWTSANLVPAILQQLDEPFYLFRITCMQAFSQLVDVVAEEQLTQVLLPALLKKAEDPVPNVKFNVSKVLQALGPNLDSSVVTNQVLPVLTMLSEDSDADVQFFAIQAMAGFTP